MTIFTVIIVIISNILLINAFLPILSSNAFHTQSTSDTTVQYLDPAILGSEFIGVAKNLENYIDTARQGLREVTSQ